MRRIHVFSGIAAFLAVALQGQVTVVTATPPAECLGVKTSDCISDPAKCSRCKQWSPPSASLRVYAAAIDESEYLFDKRPKDQPREIGNRGFVTVVEQFDNVTLPRRADGQPYSFNELYAFRKQLGFTPVKQDSVEIGDVALWNNFAGVVSGFEPDGVPTISYVGSVENGGGVGTTRADFVQDGVKPAYAKPPSTHVHGFPLQWNWWTAPAAAPFKPIRALVAGTPHRLTVDLAAVLYGGGTKARPGSRELDELVRQEKDVTLTAVLILEDGVFEEGPARVKPLVITAARLKRFKEQPFSLPKDVFGAVAEAADDIPDFTFGRVTFDLTPRHDSRRGPTSLALSLWNDLRPMDELTFDLCVGDDESLCTTPPLNSQSLQGFDSLRAQTADTAPDASVHFIPLRSGNLFGILRRKSQRDDIVVWAINTSSAEFHRYLAETVQPNIGKDASNGSLESIGTDLFDLLFPPATTGRTTFEAFLATALPAFDGTPPSLFVRFVREPGDPTVLLPTQLLATKDAHGTTQFLGFRFRIETPLDRQDYEPAPNCVTRWYFVAPKYTESDEELQRAYKRAKQQLARIEPGLARTFQSIPDFRSWIGDEKVVEPSGSALLVLSHHLANALAFEDQREKLLSIGVKKKFLQPAITLLDACGTGGAKANDFVRAFNLKGVPTLITTTSDIDPEMAGDYLACLIEEAEKQGKLAGFSLGHAHVDVLRRLATLKPNRQYAEAYGPHALAFALLGNSNVKLCAPVKEVTP